MSPLAVSKGQGPAAAWRLAGLALIMALLPAASGAQALGRLLLTPEERSDLARTRGQQAALRQGDAAGRMPASALPPDPAASAPVDPLAATRPRQVEGWVLRADGRSTVWVDGTAYYGFDTQGPARDALARRGLLAGSAPGGLKARPGQVLEGTGEKRPTDLLPEGALRIRRPGSGEATGR